MTDEQPTVADEAEEFLKTSASVEAYKQATNATYDKFAEVIREQGSPLALVQGDTVYIHGDALVRAFAIAHIAAGVEGQQYHDGFDMALEIFSDLVSAALRDLDKHDELG